MLDRRIDDPDPLGHGDAAPDRLRCHRAADGEEDIGAAAEVALDADIRRAPGPGLELMEREAVEGVHDMRRPGPLRRQPAQRACLGTEGVDNVVAAACQLRGEHAQGPVIAARRYL